MQKLKCFDYRVAADFRMNAMRF